MDPPVEELNENKNISVMLIVHLNRDTYHF